MIRSAERVWVVVLSIALSAGAALQLTEVFAKGYVPSVEFGRVVLRYRGLTRSVTPIVGGMFLTLWFSTFVLFLSATVLSVAVLYRHGSLSPEIVFEKDDAGLWLAKRYLRPAGRAFVLVFWLQILYWILRNVT